MTGKMVLLLKLSFLNLLLCLFIVSTLVACADETAVEYVAVGDQPPFNEHKVPIFRGAQNAHVRGDGATEAGGYRFLYFTTNDPPESVLSFYKEQMPRVGWLLPKEPEAMAGDLYFHCCKETSPNPEYQVTIAISYLDTSAIHVTVALTYHPR